MIKIDCPHCGTRNHDEFTYVSAANRQMPAFGSSTEAFNEYVFLRDNPKGLHWELWQHTGGCRAFVEVHRNTVTHEVLACKAPSGGLQK
ncbi:MAG: sarcosine oxidase subunit delta [Alphaproteobacteria bacterium]